MNASSPKGKSTMVIIAMLVCLTLLAALGYATWEYGRNHQWWGDSDDMRELKSDPLAAEQVLGYPRLRTEESETEVFRFKSPGDEVKNWYSTGSDDPVVARDRVIDFALDQGYSVFNSPTPQTREPVILHTPTDEGRTISARIALGSDVSDGDQNPDSENVLVIHLWFV